MNSFAWRKKIQKVTLLFITSSFLGPAATGLLVVIIAVAAGKFPVFVNGWDEATYLSWGNAKFETYPGMSEGAYWLGSAIVWVGHNLGLSGTLINVCLDLVMGSILIALTILLSRRFRIPHVIAIGAVSIAVAGTLLFGYLNPINELLNLYDPRSLVTSGRDQWNPYFRTPNPQLSLILITGQILLLISRMNNNKKIYLIFFTSGLWIFVGYIFLLPGYVCALCAWAMLQYKYKSDDEFLRKALIACGVSLVAFIAVSVVVGVKISEQFSASGPHKDLFVFLELNGRLFKNYSEPSLAIASIASIVFLLVYFIVSRRKNIAESTGFSDELFLFSMVMAFSSLASTNVQVVSGFLFEPRGFIDYGANIWASLSIAASFILISKRTWSAGCNFEKSVSKSLFLYIAICVLLSLLSQLKSLAVGVVYSFRSASGFINLKEVPAGETGEIYISPNAGISNWYPEITSMARPKEWPGLFSYQYGFKWYSEGVHANMIARKHLQVYHEYREKLGDSNKEVVRMRFILGGMICGWTPPEDGTFADNLKRAQLSQGDSVSYITIALCDSRP